MHAPHTQAVKLADHMTVLATPHVDELARRIRML
jgi:hypothetical protein